jgi:hypothetical protein
MYSLGSWFAVGSWFCISVTSNVRKSFAEIVDESALVPLVPVDPLVPLDAVELVVPLVDAAFPAAAFAPAGLAIAAPVPLNAAPAVTL